MHTLAHVETSKSGSPDVARPMSLFELVIHDAKPRYNLSVLYCFAAERSLRVGIFLQRYLCAVFYIPACFNAFQSLTQKGACNHIRAVSREICIVSGTDRNMAFSTGQSCICMQLASQTCLCFGSSIIASGLFACLPCIIVPGINCGLTSNQNDPKRSSKAASRSTHKLELGMVITCNCRICCSPRQQRITPHVQVYVHNTTLSILQILTMLCKPFRQ